MSIDLGKVDEQLPISPLNITFISNVDVIPKNGANQSEFCIIAEAITCRLNRQAGNES